MSVSVVKDKCCMCKNCIRICKFNAISFVTDEYGFEHVMVDEDKCVNCKQCDLMCPAMNHYVDHQDLLQCGAAYALNNEDKKHGSSGGLFGVLAKKIIKANGIVYGAAFDDNLKLVTTCAETEDELIPLFKSKYLLCDTGIQFKNIENHLKNNRIVLYCSTPCQIHALKLYLKKDYENLITVDFVCHGVSSQKIFDSFRDLYEKENSCKLHSFQFRQKVNNPSSSHYFSLSYEQNNKKIEKNGLYYSYPYYNAYCKQIICRSNCFDCQYAIKDRVSDITIGDFHTVEKYLKDIDRFDGVSMFLCNSIKGKKLVDSCKVSLCIKDVPKEILYANNRFSKSSKDEVDLSIRNTEDFLGEFFKNGMSKKVKKTLITKKDYIKLLYYKMPLFLRKIVKGLV